MGPFLHGGLFFLGAAIFDHVRCCKNQARFCMIQDGSAWDEEAAGGILWHPCEFPAVPSGAVAHSFENRCLRSEVQLLLRMAGVCVLELANKNIHVTKFQNCLTWS